MLHIEELKGSVVQAQSNNVTTIKPRLAQNEDIFAIKKIADAYRNELGFVHRAALAASIQKKEILYVPECGFLHFHNRLDKVSTLYHLAVVSSFHKRGVGRQLCQAWENYCRNCGMTTLRLKCPVDLTANGFYSRLGFRRIDIEPGKKRSLIVWQKKLLEGNKASLKFFASFTAGGSELQRLFKLWESGGDPRNPFAHVLYSPISSPASTTKYIYQQKKEKKIQTVWLDCGAYQVQQGKISYDELLSFLDVFYHNNQWADGYVLPDIVPLSSDSDEIVQYKVSETLYQCERFFSQMPLYIQERAIAPVQGRYIHQIKQCIETYALMGIERIGFGSWGTSGPNGSVNMLSESSLALFKTVCNMAREYRMQVHCFGIGGPNSFSRLCKNNLYPDSLDSTTWWKAGGFGSIFFPDTSQIQITVRRGIKTTRSGFENLKAETKHSCYFCEDIQKLRTSRNYRIMHNLAAWLDTLER